MELVLSHLRREHRFPTQLSEHPLVTFYQNVSLQKETFEIYREFSSIRREIKVRSLDGRWFFIDLEKYSITGGLEERNTENGDIR